MQHADARDVGPSEADLGQVQASSGLAYQKCDSGAETLDTDVPASSIAKSSKTVLRRTMCWRELTRGSGVWKNS